MGMSVPCENPLPVLRTAGRHCQLTYSFSGTAGAALTLLTRVV